nr:MAG TPA_asm: hypothetical protein [Caudoviricetes sp.]
MSMISLKAEVHCPFCGECYVRKVGPNAKSLLCRFCRMSIYLKWTTKTRLGVNKHGFARIADEPFNGNELVEDLNEVFLHEQN